jgi:hypothetical protein
MTPMQKAITLVTGISEALAAGTKHFNKAGGELKTVHEVLRCIRDEGEVTLVQPMQPSRPAGTGTTDYGIRDLGGAVVAEAPGHFEDRVVSERPTGTPTTRP